MFIVKCILFVLAVILFRLSRNAKTKENNKLGKIFLGIASACSVAWCVIVALSWTIFSIGFVLLFLTVCTYAFFKQRKKRVVAVWIFIPITVVVLFICGLFYCLNIRYSEELGYKTTKLEIVSIERNSSISGSISGNGSIIYEQMSGSVSKSDFYDLYYSLNNGGKTFLSIPAAGIPIYSVKDGETPYLLKIEDYRYFEDCNVEPAREFWPEVSVRYELYLPEGAIIEKYQLNNS